MKVSDFMEARGTRGYKSGKDSDEQLKKDAAKLDKSLGRLDAAMERLIKACTEHWNNRTKFGNMLDKGGYLDKLKQWGKFYGAVHMIAFNAKELLDED